MPILGTRSRESTPTEEHNETSGKNLEVRPEKRINTPAGAVAAKPSLNTTAKEDNFDAAHHEHDRDAESEPSLDTMTEEDGLDAVPLEKGKDAISEEDLTEAQRLRYGTRTEDESYASTPPDQMSAYKREVYFDGMPQTFLEYYWLLPAYLRRKKDREALSAKDPPDTKIFPEFYSRLKLDLLITCGEWQFRCNKKVVFSNSRVLKKMRRRYPLKPRSDGEYVSPIERQYRYLIHIEDVEPTLVARMIDFLHFKNYCEPDATWAHAIWPWGEEKCHDGSSVDNVSEHPNYGSEISGKDPEDKEAQDAKLFKTPRGNMGADLVKASQLLYCPPDGAFFGSDTETGAVSGRDTGSETGNPKIRRKKKQMPRKKSSTPAKTSSPFSSAESSSRDLSKLPQLLTLTAENLDSLQRATAKLSSDVPDTPVDLGITDRSRCTTPVTEPSKMSVRDCKNPVTINARMYTLGEKYRIDSLIRFAESRILIKLRDTPLASDVDTALKECILPRPQNDRFRRKFLAVLQQCRCLKDERSQEEVFFSTRMVFQKKGSGEKGGWTWKKISGGYFEIEI